MSHFFAYMSRMKYITRWGLMRNIREENIQEHSMQVAMIAHGLALIRNTFFSHSGQVDEEHIAVLALFHEVSEVITGDLATPIKYFNPEISTAYKRLEGIACDKLIEMIPTPLKGKYRSMISPASEDAVSIQFVKAADKLSAYLKCLEEKKAGNHEFNKATISIYKSLMALDMPEVNYFIKEFAQSFELTLDELN